MGRNDYLVRSSLSLVSSESSDLSSRVIPGEEPVTRVLLPADISIQVSAPPEDTPVCGDDRVASSGSLEPPAPALQPDPKISMDYFYLAGVDEEEKDRLDRMTTSEMRKRLREIGRSDAGIRNVLKKRLRNYSQDGGNDEDGQARAHASTGTSICVLSITRVSGMKETTVGSSRTCTRN